MAVKEPLIRVPFDENIVHANHSISLMWQDRVVLHIEPPAPLKNDEILAISEVAGYFQIEVGATDESRLH